MLEGWYFYTVSQSFTENQLDVQFIFSISCQTPLHVSGVSIAHHQEVPRMDTTIGTYCAYCSNPARTTDCHLK